jgi:hypothetical protein
MGAKEREDERIGQLALDQAVAEHAQLVDDWKGLDIKAQGATAISGILLAAVTTYVKSDSHLHGMQLTLFLASLLALVASIYYAVSSMRLRQLPFPVAANESEKWANALLQQSGEGRAAGLQFDILNRYVKTNQRIVDATVSKAYDVFRSQVALVFGAVASLLLILVPLFFGG